MTLLTVPVRSTHRALLLLAALCVLTQCRGESVRCWKCRHTAASNDNNIVVKVFLKTITNTIGYEKCQMDDPKSDKYAVDIVECPQVADSGMVYKCSTVKGQVTTSIATFAVIWDTTIRDCVQVPTNDDKYTNCHQTEHVTGPLRYLLEEAFKGLTKINVDAEVAFKGTTCYDSASKAMPDRDSIVQCVTCSRNELTSKTTGISSILSFFSSKVSNDECLMRNPDDTYRVFSRICPEPASDEQAVCGVISGVASIPAVGLKFLTTERGCVTQPRGEKQSGCSTELPPDGALKTLFKSGIQGLDFEITFEGKVCYSVNGFGEVTALGLVDLSGAERLQGPLSVLLILSAIMSTILRQYL